MSDQVGEFLDKANQVVNPPDAPKMDLSKPKVPFQTGLKLTLDQETKMMDHAFARMKTISNELGRDQTLNPTWWTNQSSNANTLLASQGLQTADTWMGKRTRYEATFLNDVTWRPWTMGPDNIFMSSNLSVPIVRRVCRQMIARAKNSFFGGDPWFSLDPSPVITDPQNAEQDAARDAKVEAFCRFKLGESQSNTAEDIGESISRALILGECAVKTSYIVRDQIFDTEATVMTDVEGTPMRGADGNHITQNDQWVDAEDGKGTKVLKRDGQTPQPMAPIWQNMPLNRRQVLFEGCKSEVIFYKDFLCPLTAKSVQEADCIVHLYDKAVMEFVDLVVKRGMVDDTAEDRLGAAQRMVALVQALSENTSQPKSAEASQLRPNENFMSPPSTENGGPIAEFAEFYLWFDANGDGVAENIMLIADRNTKVPIFYDHVANVTTDGLRPIEIVRINPVAGRWYGLGIHELFESYQYTIDLLINRWNFSQSRSGRVDFWNPTETLEGDRDPSLKLNWGGTYTKKPGKKAEDILETVHLTDVKFEQIHEQALYFQQLLMNESGVSTGNDGQAAGLQSSKLATGIINVQQSGDELFQPVIDDLRGPITRILGREIDVTLANMNPVEVYTYLKGDTMGVDQLTPDDVRGLKYLVKIELTAMRNQQQMQLSAQTAALVEKFYLLSPAVQMKVAPFYRQQIRLLDPKCDVDTTIQPMPNSPPPPPPPKTSVAVALKGEDLNPVEKAALMGDLGVTETAEQAGPAAGGESTDGGRSPVGKAGPAGGTPHATQLTQAATPAKS